MTNTVPTGALVILPDGSQARCYRDCGIGRPWDGRYVTCQVNRSPAARAVTRAGLAISW